MPTRTHIASHTARALRSADLSHLRGVLGFDGFIDDIIDVVAQRHSVDRYDRHATMAAFAQILAGAAGQGCNVELVVTRQKLGGNGPIMGNALAFLGVPLTYIGAVGGAGSDSIHTVFQDFATRATLIPLGAAAHTHALEFSDGKLMMGELAPLSEITWDRLLQRVGRDRLLALFEHATLIGLLNWTMLPFATDLWRGIGQHILPHLSPKPRRIFVDLADPKKRTQDDLLAALRVLTQLNTHTPVTLGLNAFEAQQVAAALQIAIPSILPAATVIRQRLALDTVVIHPTASAAAANAQAAAEFAGPVVKEPKILTGAGDHFNTGFVMGQLLALPLENCLCLGTALSGYYVRNAASPTQIQLAEFLDHLPEPQSP